MAVQKIFPQQIDYTYRTVTSDSSIVDSDNIILANSTFGIKLSLPDAVGANGSSFTIKNINTGNITILPSGSDLIDGQANLVVQYRYSAVGLISLGSSGWIIV